MKVRASVLCVHMVVAVSCLGMAARCSAQNSNTGQIVGHVTDQLGAAISRASVFVRRNTPSDDNVRLVTRTDINGDFTLLLPEGSYDVLIASPGFASGLQTVPIMRGKKPRFEWRLIVLGCDMPGTNCDSFPSH